MIIQDEKGNTTPERYHVTVLQYMQKAIEIEHQVQKLLKGHTQEDIMELLLLYRDKQFLENYACVRPNLLYVRILASITVQEIQEGLEHKLIDRFFCIEDFRSEWEKVKALFWELDFGFDELSEERFCRYVEHEELSFAVIKHLIGTSSVSRKRTVMLLACAYLNRNEIDFAAHILDIGVELCEEDEELIHLKKQLMEAIGQ